MCKGSVLLLEPADGMRVIVREWWGESAKKSASLALLNTGHPEFFYLGVSKLPTIVLYADSSSADSFTGGE